MEYVCTNCIKRINCGRISNFLCYVSSSSTRRIHFSLASAAFFSQMAMAMATGMAAGAGLAGQQSPIVTIAAHLGTTPSSCTSSWASQSGLALLPIRNRAKGRFRWDGSIANSPIATMGSSQSSRVRFASSSSGNAGNFGGLAHFGPEFRTSQLVGYLGKEKRARVRCNASAASSRPASKPRFIQHKQEAFWFYRFLSIVYDHIINPGHWTEDMREDALEPAALNDKDLVVVDVGGGTGFATLGIIKTVDAKNVTILDQSPHQLAKAKEKAPLRECTIVEGDAEDLPFETDYADRYVSAGSIEYWPDPQRGIKEAYRVLKKGGKACLIGPVHPTFWLSRFFADVWMLFPTEEEYIEWFTKAGFTDVQIKRIGPKWYRGVRRHGLIMGCSVTGVKSESGDSPLQLGPKAEDSKAPFNPITFAYRFLVGTIASLYYVLIPIYMWLKDLVLPKGQPI